MRYRVFAKLRRDAGESIEDVSRFLDHSSLAVTTTYLRRLEGQEDLGRSKVAKAIGLSSFDPTRMRPYASDNGGDYPHGGTERV